MTTSSRCASLDALRLIAALFVVVLHVDELTQDLPESIATALRLLGRWAVPFFFLLTGYFLGGDSQTVVRRCATQSKKLLWIFGIASLLYIPEVIWYYGLHNGLSLLTNPAVLLYGTEFHLWFLSSLIVGLQVIRLFYFYQRDAWLPLLTVTLMVAALATGSYRALFGANGLESPAFDLARHLLSISFINIGMHLAHGRIRFSMRTCLMLIMVGLALECTETWLLKMCCGDNPLNHEFLIGTFPLSIGIFGFATSIKLPIDNWLAMLGHRYSLGIYIAHVWWLSAARRVLWHLPHFRMPSLGIVGIVFCASLLSAMLFESQTVRVKRWLTSH